jgi:hypothetical protein
VFKGISRGLFSVVAFAAIAGCNSTDVNGLKPTGDQAQTAQPAVIQGSCPQVYLRDGTASLDKYANGGKGDPSKIVYQASIAATTRQCTLGQNSMTVTVVAQGRLVGGPLGKPGKVVLPIRVAATDGETTLYSELTNFEVELPATMTTQFIFTKADVTIPGGAGTLAKIYVGFDEGPYKTK